MGPDGPDEHRKGRNRISTKLACFMNDTYPPFDSANVIDTTTDLLCTSCLNFKTSRMDSVASSHEMDTTEVTRSTMRAAALLASARISNQSRSDQMDLGEQAQHYSSEEMDDETPELEEAQRRAQAISRLNGIFEFLSEKRIDDMRNQNVLRAQTNTAILTIRELVEHVLPTGAAEVLRESMGCDYTLSETEELIQGLKRLIQCSDYAEQIRLLTLAPRSWGRAKVESFFTCSERQARYGVYLRDSGRILHRPVDLRGNLPFDPQIEKKIFEFYHDDMISRVRIQPPKVSSLTASISLGLTK